MSAMFHVGDQGRLEAFPGELVRQLSKFPVLRRRLDPGLEDYRQASTERKRPSTRALRRGDLQRGL